MIKRRVDHLKEAESLQPHAKPLWHKKRLDRMLVEYFLRSGYYNTALKLAQHSDIEVDYDYTCHENIVFLFTWLSYQF